MRASPLFLLFKKRHPAVKTLLEFEIIFNLLFQQDARDEYFELCIGLFHVLMNVRLRWWVRQKTHLFSPAATQNKLVLCERWKTSCCQVINQWQIGVWEVYLGGVLLHDDVVFLDFDIWILFNSNWPNGVFLQSADANNRCLFSPNFFQSFKSKAICLLLSKGGKFEQRLLCIKNC